VLLDTPPGRAGVPGRPPRALAARRAGLAAAALLFFLAAAVVVAVLTTGGFAWRSGTVRISIRQPFNPALVAAAAAIAVWALSSREERRRVFAAALAFRTSPENLARASAVTAALLVMAFALFKGLFTAGGADAYGYVSQAELWARGSLIVEQPYARDMTWPDVRETLAPLGYRPYGKPPSTDIVPIYSPGLPLVMAPFQMIGGRRAVFLVVPLLGALAVWATYCMGRKFAGPLVGALSSILLATSPSFLIEVTSPTSDVPVTAWWASAFALLLGAGPWTAFASGIATSFAVLTRPNLVPLGAVPALLLVWIAWKAWSRPAMRRVVAFSAGAVLGPLFIAVLNWQLYGSPLTSGYGRLNEIYAWHFLGANLARYPRWLLEGQTPIILLAFVAPFVLPRTGERAHTRTVAAAWLCFALGVLGAYLFYQPYDEWVYLRFLLPALPPLHVLTAAALCAIAAPLKRAHRIVPGLVVATVAVFVVSSEFTEARDRGAAILWKAEQRYPAAGRYIAAKLPERAALFSMQHSGSARYYSGRITIRYDVLAPDRLDDAIDELQRHGYAPYFLLDDWEEPLFRARFRGHSARADLDWWPLAVIAGSQVKIYDPTDREAGRPDRSRTPDIVP
jgi:hypothetical protein